MFRITEICDLLCAMY